MESAQAEDGEELRLRTLTERALWPMSGRNGGVGIVKGEEWVDFRRRTERNGTQDADSGRVGILDEDGEE